MQNNHVVPSIELLCLYLANSYNSTHDITVVIRFHCLMQHNHVLSSIEFLWWYVVNVYEHFIILTLLSNSLPFDLTNTFSF